MTMSFREWLQQLIDQYRKKQPTPKPTPTPAPTPTPKPTPHPAQKTETARYHGRFNGDRATFYFTKNIADYPRSITLSVPGCYDSLHIAHNGVRYDKGGLILKQSDVKGRGMALVLPAKCKSTQASITFSLGEG